MQMKLNIQNKDLADCDIGDSDIVITCCPAPDEKLPESLERFADKYREWRRYLRTANQFDKSFFIKYSRMTEAIYIFLRVDENLRNMDYYYQIYERVKDDERLSERKVYLDRLPAECEKYAFQALSLLDIPVVYLLGANSGDETLYKVQECEKALLQKKEQEETARRKVQNETSYYDSEEDKLRQRTVAEEFNNSNFIAAKGCSYSLNDISTRLNNNVLIVGGSGTGKTRHIVTPNIHEAVGSYFICDPKGLLHKKYSGYLKKQGYDTRLIDFTHPEKSDGYNPMDYIHSTQDITKLATILIDANERECLSIDPYWDRMTLLLISAIIGYLIEKDSPKKDFGEILRLVRMGERKDSDDKDSPLQQLFSKHRKLHPDSWACDKFDSVDCAPYKTYDTIRSTLNAKFSNLDTEELRQMMSRETFDFTMVARRKTAVFVTVSDTDRTHDTLVNLFFSQAMNELCGYADDNCEGGRLPIPVRFILDDFATNCRIEEFPRMISSIRSRALSVMLMIQSESQLWQGYNHDARTIISNCDTYVYLGGNDKDTAAAVAERSDRPMNEVLYMPVGSCWAFRRGSPPVNTSLIEVEEVIKEMEK